MPEGAQRSAVDPGHPAGYRGEQLVLDGARQVGGVLRADRLRAVEDDLIPYPDIGDAIYRNHAQIHAHPPHDGTGDSTN